jgi:hypothetical protein
MPHLGHVHAANSVQHGRRKTDRQPPPQRGLQLGVIWYRLLTRFERPRIRRRVTDPQPTPTAAATSHPSVARRSVLQIRADIGVPNSP